MAILYILPHIVGSEANVKTQVLDFSGHLDYDKLIGQLSLLEGAYPALAVGYIGATILDRAIPMVTLGNPSASKSVLYLGGVGGDSIPSAVLLRFICDYCEFLKSGRRMFSVNLPYLHANRRICVIPMLNCDGCSLRHRTSGSSPAEGTDGAPTAAELMKERLLRMNEGSEDFGAWCANARGVDLRRNFPEGFGQGGHDRASFGCRGGYCGTAPESEPETAALCNAVRMHHGTSLLLRLHTDDNALTLPAAPAGAVPRIRTMGRLLSRMSGTQIVKKATADGAPEDWYAAVLRQPALAMGCRYPDTDGSPDDGVKIYAYLREVLFSAPLLI